MTCFPQHCWQQLRRRRLCVCAEIGGRFALAELQEVAHGSRPARNPSRARPWHEHRLSVCVPPLGRQRQLAGMLRLFQPRSWQYICCSRQPAVRPFPRAQPPCPGEPCGGAGPRCGGGGESGGTCGSGSCLISAKNPPMFGNEAFRLC